MAVSRPDLPPLLELHGQSQVADAPEIAGADDLGFEWVEREAVLVHFQSFSIIRGGCCDSVLGV